VAERGDRLLGGGGTFAETAKHEERGGKEVRRKRDSQSH